MSKPTFSFTVSSTPDTCDTILSRLNQPGFLGCEESGGSVEIRLTAHFRTEPSAREAKELISALLPDRNIGITGTEPQDWNAKWRESMKPARIARGYYVSPLWLPPPETCRHWIKIEPKMTFGTGHHETTKLAAQAIISLKSLLRKKRILDIGTGSGVLCFVADRCGASYALGVEIDPDCRENIAENLKNNRPAGRIAFLIGSTDSLKVTEHFDLVVMNMLLTESAPLLSHVSCLLKPGGRFIWTGILTDEHRKTIALAKPHGLRCIAGKEENEWWCGTYIKNRAGKEQLINVP
jgi:ribosomal protein L11 methyltransferase